MRIYKLYYPIEDYEDDSWKDMWKEVNVYTEAQMRELCEEYIKDDTITPETYCEYAGLDFDTFDVNSLDLSKTDIDTIIEIFEYDGYVVDYIDLPEYEPTYNQDGTYTVKHNKQEDVCDAGGFPYAFDSIKDAKEYIDNLNNLMNKN